MGGPWRAEEVGPPRPGRAGGRPGRPGSTARPIAPRGAVRAAGLASGLPSPAALPCFGQKAPTLEAEPVLWSWGADGRRPRFAPRRVLVFCCPPRAASGPQTATSTPSPRPARLSFRRAGKLFCTPPPRLRPGPRGAGAQSAGRSPCAATPVRPAALPTPCRTGPEAMPPNRSAASAPRRGVPGPARSPQPPLAPRAAPRFVCQPAPAPCRSTSPPALPRCTAEPTPGQSAAPPPQIAPPPNDDDRRRSAPAPADHGSAPRPGAAAQPPASPPPYKPHATRAPCPSPNSTPRPTP